MSIKKKNRRKKRFPQTIKAMPTEERKKVVYQDNFQRGVGNKIEKLMSTFEGRGKIIFYGFASIALLMILVSIFYIWNRRTSNVAQTALGKAIETGNATVTEAPVPAVATYKTFKTQKERAKAAIKEFQFVADNYGSPFREKARYFIATHRLQTDRPSGIKELEELTLVGGNVGILSKFVLAQIKNNEGKLEEAAKYYQELSQLKDPVVSKETVNFELARIYEKRGKTKEAIDLYFNIVKEANEVEDSQGNSLPQTQTAIESKEKLEELSPERAKEIKTSENSSAEP